MKKNLTIVPKDKKFDYVGKISNNVLRVKSGGSWGLINDMGEIIIPLKYQEIMSLSFNQGLIAVLYDNKWGLLNRKGEEVSYPKYDDLYPFYGKYGISKVKKGIFWGLINKDGEEITNIHYTNIELFGKGFALRDIDGHWDFILTDNSRKSSQLQSK